MQLRRPAWCLFVALVLAWPGMAFAQLVPPQIVELPPLVVPDDVELPEEGSVEVVIVVLADATASVEMCPAGELLCELIRGAIRGAKFRAATRDGRPIAGRASIRLSLAHPTGDGVPPPSAAESMQPVEPSARAPAAGSGSAKQQAKGAPLPEYGATARTAPPQPGMRRLELAEMRDLPGAFGDPFRAIDALPGVVPIFSGLPYFFIRGSPPAGTLYVYDDIPVPTLYHLAVGPAVIHPRMVGPIRLYSGVAPARYGRLTGGAVVGEGPARPDGVGHGELELRLLDVSGYAQGGLFGGTATAAVRYGYPGLLLTLISSEASLAYWDYQLRYEHSLSSRDRVELVALGSYDAFAVKSEPKDEVTITFHRFEPRFIRRTDSIEYGVALLLGWEESALGSGFRLQATRVGPRMWLEHRFGDGEKLRVSADLQGIAGYFSASDPTRNRRNDGNTLFGDIPARSLWGVQEELTLRPLQWLELQLGARSDAWVQGAAAEAVTDPRTRVIFHVRDDLDLHVAAGVVHQPAVFYVPLPGIVDVAVDRGLQAAIQTEAGVGWDTPLALRAEVQGFLHRYLNLVFADALVLGDTLDTICSTIQCGGATVPTRIDGLAYGAEVFLRRPVTERLSGWISYTLAFADVDDVAGLPYTPTWDVRHVGNLVLQWNIGAGVSAGARWLARSGKMHGEFVIDDAFKLARFERRLPWFTRLDLELAYAWRPSWGRMRVSLEWFNATLSREPQDIECSGSPRTCQVRYLPAIFFPNLGLRGEI